MAETPVPIHRVAQHYYLYDAPTIARLRAEQHILGIPIGTLPQANQQNIFCGLPLLLLPEEARLLCERGVGFVVDDAKRHAEHFASPPNRERREAFAVRLDAVGRGIGACIAGDKARERDAALKKMGEKEKLKRAKRAEEKRKAASQAAAEADADAATDAVPDGSATMSDVAVARAPVGSESGAAPPTFDVYSVTPMTSQPPLLSPSPPRTPLSAPDTSSSLDLPPVPSSYALYRHLHSQGYFLHPGLRFGCQYMAYPGDPLRFHSHFLVVSRAWDEEVALSTLIGCGRLGTGVKKGFLVGGVEEQQGSAQPDDGVNEEVRCFSIEWSGM